MGFHLLHYFFFIVGDALRLDMGNKQLHWNKGGLHRIIEDLNKQRLINETSWLV